MSDWITPFLFTYKADAILNELQRAIRYDAIAIAICILYSFYITVSKIRKKTYFDKKLVPVALFILIFGIISFQDHQSTFRYF